MKSYNAKLGKSNDPRFNEWLIVLKTLAPVHKTTLLSYIEPIDEDADSSEIAWYNHIVKVNLRKDG